MTLVVAITKSKAVDVSDVFATMRDFVLAVVLEREPKVKTRPVLTNNFNEPSVVVRKTNCFT